MKNVRCFDKLLPVQNGIAQALLASHPTVHFKSDKAFGFIALFGLLLFRLIVSVPVQETFTFIQPICVDMQLKKMILLHMHLSFIKYAIVVNELNSIMLRHRHTCQADSETGHLKLKNLCGIIILNSRYYFVFHLTCYQHS